MISIIIFLLSIMSFSFFAAFCLKKDFEKTMPVYSMGIVLFLFLAGMVNLLAAGVVVVLLVSMGLYVATPIVLKKRGQNYKDGLNHFITTGTVIFAALCLFILYINYGRLAMFDDEFSHWMDIVKIMTRLDHFGTPRNSGAIFSSYPPAMALYQYFLQKIQFMFGQKEFSEWKAYFAYQLLSAMAMLPFVSVAKKGALNKVQSVVTYLGCLIMPLLLFDKAYTSIYIDPFMGVLAASGIAAVILWEDKDWLYALYETVLCGTLVLSKDVGMYLVIFVIAIFTVEYYFSECKSVVCKKSILRILVGLAPIVATMAAKMLWKLELSISHTKVQFNRPINFAGVKAVLNGTDDTYFTEVYNNFWKAMTYRYIYYERAGVNYVAAIAIVAIVLLYLLIKLKQQGVVKSRRTVILVTVLITISIVAYALSLFPLYISRFSQQEAVEVASFERYISIVLLMEFLLSWLLARKVLENLTYRTKWGFVLSVLLIISACHAKRVILTDLMTKISVQNSITSRSRFTDLANEIATYCDPNTSIGVLIQDSDSLVSANLQFMVKPYTVDDIYESHLAMSPDDFLDEVSDTTDYLVIYNATPDFVVNFGSVFDEDAEVGNNHIYKYDATKDKFVQVF